MPKDLRTLKLRRKRTPLVDKDLLKFFPKPDRMGAPIPTLWERSSSIVPQRKQRQSVQNSY